MRHNGVERFASVSSMETLVAIVSKVSTNLIMVHTFNVRGY